MYDIKWIRDNPDDFDEGLRRRGWFVGEEDSQAALLLELDKRCREARTRAQEIQTARNKAAKEIGNLKARGGDAGELIEEVSRSKTEQAQAEDQARAAAGELDGALAAVPNRPDKDVPDGEDESANREIRSWGDKPAFDFEAREHFEIGEGLAMMDFETAAKMSGARFVVLTGVLARMERALASFMLDMHTTEFGYVEVNPPALVRDGALFGTGQLPKFGDDLFRTADGFWLIPTAEVPLTNLVAGQVLDADTLPRRYAAMTWCFRSEAGAAGKDTRGMIRQHQFTKVELVSVVHPDESSAELERMTSCAEEVLKRLYLPYRVVVLCAGEMGFSAAKTHDIEVWLPGQDRYREISSCSDCTGFQARRMNARFREKGKKETGFVHTLNGSALAVGRTLIAILENNQRSDGSVMVPEALRPYMGGLEVIKPQNGG
ncbi:MAG: serine--tRNA ligase [Rhodospirillales bacterium]